MTKRLKPLINVCLSLAGLLVSAGCQDASATKPLVEITGPEEAVFVAHEVKNQEYLTIPLTLKSFATESLNVKVSEKSCGCLSIVMPDEQLPAFGTQPIELRLATSQSATRRSISFALHISGNGRSAEMKRTQKYRCVANETGPTVLDIKLADTVTTQTTKLTSRVYSTHPAKLHAANARLSGLPSEISVRNASSGEIFELYSGVFCRDFVHNLECHYSPRVDAGIYGRCTITFGSSEMTSNSIPILLVRSTGVNVSPDVQLFPLADSSRAVGTTIRRSVIRALDRRDFHILRCQVDSPLWNARALSQERRPTQIVEFKLNDETDLSVDASVEGTATIFTSHPDAPTVSISLKANGTNTNTSPVSAAVP